jgi:hypothetical protein
MTPRSVMMFLFECADYGHQTSLLLEKTRKHLWFREVFEISMRRSNISAK